MSWINLKDLDEIMERRRDLVARCDKEREQIACGTEGLKTPLLYAARGYRVAAFVRNNPVMVGLGTAFFSRMIVSHVLRLLGKSPSRPQKRGLFGTLSLWGGRVGTVATMVQQLYHFCRQSHRHSKPVPEEQENSPKSR